MMHKSLGKKKGGWGRKEGTEGQLRDGKLDSKWFHSNVLKRTYYYSFTI